MKTKQFITDVLSAVADETEIDTKLILSQDKHRENVDARHIAIFLMSKYGVYASTIAEIFGITPRNVQYIVSDFPTRLKQSTPMRKNYERIMLNVGKDFENIAK